MQSRVTFPASILTNWTGTVRPTRGGDLRTRRWNSTRAHGTQGQLWRKCKTHNTGGSSIVGKLCFTGFPSSECFYYEADVRCGGWCVCCHVGGFVVRQSCWSTRERQRDVPTAITLKISTSCFSSLGRELDGININKTTQKTLDERSSQWKSWEWKDNGCSDPGVTFSRFNKINLWKSNYLRG